jgi:uncharacterized repeat protein (TIGR01451 family)
VTIFKRHVSILLVLCAVALLALCAPASSLAVEVRPQWTVTAFSDPTNLSLTAGASGVYRVYVQNTGEAPSDGGEVTVTDVLPPGLKASSSASGLDFDTGTAMSCAGLTCTYSAPVGLENILAVSIPVEVAAGAKEGTQANVVSVAGGGAGEVVRETPTVFSSTRASFGIAPGSTALALSSTQAGAHPDLTATLAFNSAGLGLPAGNVRESAATLPPGFVGDLADTPKCPIAGFSEENGLYSEALHCSLSTVVGTVTVYLGSGPARLPVLVPLLNLATNPGEIARLGFNAFIVGIEGTISLRPGSYAVRTSFEKIPDTSLAFEGISLTVWGVPSDPSHDLMRGLVALVSGPGEYVNETTEGRIAGRPAKELPDGQSVTTPAIPYLTSPTQCTGKPLETSFEANSWEEPEHEVSVSTPVGPFTGCGLLEFAPGITASPDTINADTPAGFSFGASMNQQGLVDRSLNSQADVKDTTVTLPEGVAINPGQANGLGACQESQEELGKEAPTACPSDSKVGTVEIETPVLRDKLDGNVYVLQSDPPNLKLLAAPEDPPDGIYVKFVGDVHLNETTGQLVTSFENTPQLPFSNLKFNFSGGAQAALSTPTTCNTYNLTTDFTPWSSPFVPDAFPSGSFAIESGTGGAACPSSPLPFSPALIAGPTTDQAGGFTDFSLLLTRADDQQRISTLQFKTPEGLLGEIAKVPLCPEPQASQGTCSSSSQIGHTVVEAGPGPYPLVVPQPGQPPAPIYLTGPYEGAPFGLSIVVPLVVGPFTLQTQVVRARIEVDPLTSQLTVTTSPLPQMIDGVPADLRDINAVIDRPEFMFNPTSCAPTSFSGTATSAQGASAPISSRTQFGSCQSLKFKPDFKVSTSGKTSRADGASLDAKIVYPTGDLGDNQASSQSNIKSVKVDLPKQLPSRLTTLQKACPAATFEANPALCPADSRVGAARAITPVLPVPLTGPAFFVSYGGAKFPELVIALQGYGVTIYLHGETFISKAGITSSTFRQIPDVPIASFEISLPEGPFSALAANGNLCTVKGGLQMPTAFTAQNGAVIHQNTPIGVTKCPSIRPPARAKKKAKGSKARKAAGPRKK